MKYYLHILAIAGIAALSMTSAATIAVAAQENEAQSSDSDVASDNMTADDGSSDQMSSDDGSEQSGDSQSCPPGSACEQEKQLKRYQDLPVSEQYALGFDFLEQGEPNKALVLFQTAARRDHGPAAREVGRMYDPVLWGTVPTPFVKPDAWVASNWYCKALSLGDTGAQALLDALAAWQVAENTKQGNDQVMQLSGCNGSESVWQNI